MRPQAGFVRRSLRLRGLARGTVDPYGGGVPLHPLAPRPGEPLCYTVADTTFTGCTTGVTVTPSGT